MVGLLHCSHISGNEKLISGAEKGRYDVGKV